MIASRTRNLESNLILKTVPLFYLPLEYRTVYQVAAAAASRNPWGYRTGSLQSVGNPCRCCGGACMVFYFSRFGFWSGLRVLRHCAKKTSKKKTNPCVGFSSFLFFFFLFYLEICAAPHASGSLVRYSRSRAEHCLINIGKKKQILRTRLGKLLFLAGEGRSAFFCCRPRSGSLVLIGYSRDLFAFLFLS